jgi:hypothetical protein
VSDHGSGPRAFADPVIDITDMYAFPCPDRPGYLVLVMNVFPFAGASAALSDAVDYRFRIRPVSVAAIGPASTFSVGASEFSLHFRFKPPASADRPLRQSGTCSSSTGESVALEVNDERGAESKSRNLRVFVGLRMDPFFFDGARAGQTVLTGKLAFEKVGTSAVAHQNVFAIVAEVAIDSMFGSGAGPMFGIVCETATLGSPFVRLERFGRPEIKNVILFNRARDPVNKDLEIRDLYNQEDAFNLGKAYLGAFRARMNSMLPFWDGIDGKIDWPLNKDGNHPLTELLLADFMTVDTSKSFAEDTFYEIERSIVAGKAPSTCGGRWLNHDALETILTWLVNRDDGPRIQHGVAGPAEPAKLTFPYLVPPEPNPPQLPPLPKLDTGKP